MNSQPLRHLHLPHPHVDVRRLGRDAVIAAELGLAATAVAASGRMIHAATHGTESAVSAVQADQSPSTIGGVSVDIHSQPGGVLATVHGLDPTATNLVLLMTEQGKQVQGAPSAATAIHFGNVPAGRYRVVVSSEGPVIEVDGSSISSEVVVRSASFTLTAPGIVTVESH